MFLGWPFWKFLPEILIPQETWLWWRGLLALYGNEEKNSSSLKSLINFKIVSQKYSLRDPFQKLFTKLLSVYSHGSGCEDLFALQGDKKNFLFLLHWKGWSDFEIISEMFLGWPFSKIVREIFIFICLKNNNQLLAPTCGALVWCKIIFSESIGWISTKFGRNVPWVTVFKNRFDLWKNMAVMGRSYFHYVG